MDKAAELLVVVEDSDEDYYALHRAIQKVCSPTHVVRCTDGDEALDLICGTTASANQPNPVESSIKNPAAVLLDLNLPGTDGREVLEQLKQDNRYKSIPVVIFSTSSNPRDIEFCYKTGANGYLVKPMDVGELQNLIKAFADYWLRSNTPPPETMPNDLFPLSTY
ncbi:MAG: response regulator [Cyanobacteria bacterium P01_A01_bin.3]